MTACGRGRPLDDSKVQKIVQLLRGSELTILEIAQRLQCSKGTVVTVNRRNQVRSYNGRRSFWILDSSGEA